VHGHDCTALHCTGHCRVYLCGKPAKPIVALGGSMLDCEHGQWVLGRPHNQTGALRTMAYGLMSNDQTAGAHLTYGNRCCCDAPCLLAERETRAWFRWCTQLTVVDALQAYLLVRSASTSRTLPRRRSAWPWYGRASRKRTRLRSRTWARGGAKRSSMPKASCTSTRCSRASSLRNNADAA
jgi:hypothetical protein